MNAFKLHLEDRHGLSEGTIRNYMKAVRKFFLWRDTERVADVTVGSPPERKYDPEETITADELDAMLEAANNFDAATREKALIATLRDTGLRIGAVLSIQLKHVDLEGKRATLSINSEANVKDADGPKPVTGPAPTSRTGWMSILAPASRRGTPPQDAPLGRRGGRRPPPAVRATHPGDRRACWS